MKIEETHKNNFKLIKQYDIKKGGVFKHKETGEFCTIDHIHPLYGWVVSDPYAIKQDLSNINEYERVKIMYKLKLKEKTLTEGTLEACIYELLNREDNIYHALAHKYYTVELDGVKIDVPREAKHEIENKYNEEKYFKYRNQIELIVRELGLNMIENDNQDPAGRLDYSNIWITAGRGSEGNIRFAVTYNSRPNIEISPIFDRNIKGCYVSPYEYKEVPHSVKMNPFKSMKLIKTQFEKKYLPEHDRLIQKNKEEVKKDNEYIKKTAETEKKLEQLKKASGVYNVKVHGNSVSLELWSITVDQALKVCETLK